MGLKFYVGPSAWEELGEELARVLSGEGALVLGFGLSSGEEELSREHDVQTPFTEEVKKKSQEIAQAFGAEVYLHLHPNTGSVTYVLKIDAKNAVERFRGLLKLMSECENCFVTGIEGEVRVGEELAALIFGSSAKATFVLPGADGRRLKILDLLLSV